MLATGGDASGSSVQPKGAPTEEDTALMCLEKCAAMRKEAREAIPNYQQVK